MRVVLGASVAIAMLSGCATGTGSGASAEPPHATTRVLGTVATQSATASDAASPSTMAAAGPCGRGGSPAGYTHVIWIWMENRSYSQVLGTSGAATRLRSYARRCGVATSYYAITHPSLPNYLAAVSGSTGGVRSDCSPATCPQRRPTLFRQLSRHGREWRSYAESMASPCDRASYGRYAARHNPAVYFPGIRDSCRRWDLAMGGRDGRFATALKKRTLRAFTFVAPNLCSDGHDCSTATADTWLGTWLDRIVASPTYAAGHTLVFVTWDEGLVNSTNRIATVAIGPTVTPGTRSSTRYSHYSLLRTTEELLGLPLLAAAAKAHSMRSML